MLGQTITFENPLSELEIYGFTPYFTYVYHTRVPISHLIGGTEDSKKVIKIYMLRVILTTK